MYKDQKNNKNNSNIIYDPQNPSCFYWSIVFRKSFTEVDVNEINNNVSGAFQLLQEWKLKNNKKES